MTLSIQLLGSPEVRLQGVPLHFRSRKVLALLIYLIVTQEKHSRDSLIAIFWSSSNRERGRNSLRTTISRLRQTLSAIDNMILTEGDFISFNFQKPYTLDLNTIQNANRNDSSIEDMQAAILCYRDEFLSGFGLKDAVGFDEWASIEREAYHQQIELILGRLCREQLDRLSSSQAIQTALSWLSISPLSERAYQHLIEAHLLTGNRTSALQIFEACAQMLRTEFGIEPSSQTSALLHTSRPVTENDNPSQLSVIAPKITLPFVGRGDVHQKLVRVFRQMCAGSSQVVLISGSAGIGKTTLVQTFLDWVSLQPAKVDQLYGRAFEMGGRLSYQPIIQAMRQRLERENAPDDLLSDVWLVELSRILPELRERYPDLDMPSVGEDEVAKSRLFESVAQLGNALSERVPLIFTLDDLQWIDEGSLDILQYVVHRWQELNAPILLLLTIRSESLLMNQGLKDWLHLLQRDSRFTELILAPLEEKDMIEIIKQLMDKSDSDQTVQEFSQWLFTGSNGSPFFVDAFIQMLIEENMLSRVIDNEAQFDFEAAWQAIKMTNRLPLPSTIRDLILARLRRLSEQEHALLLSAAVIGRQCKFEDMCQIGGVDELEGLNALETLMTYSLLTEQEIANLYTVTHDNIREVVYSQAGEARRRIYHRRTFDLLKLQNTSAAELVFHAYEASLPEHTFYYRLEAADEAAATFDFREAVNQFSLAWQMVVNNHIQASSEKLVYLCERFGRALEMNNQIDKAMDFYKSISDLARETNDQPLQLQAIIGQATIRATPVLLQDLEQAEILANNAIELAQTLHNRPAEAKALWLLQLSWSFSRLDPRKAVYYGEASLAIARELDLREQLAFTLQDLIAPYRDTRQSEKARDAEIEARNLWHELNNQPMLADSYNTAAYWAFWIDSDYEKALEMSTKGLQLSERFNNLYNQFSAQVVKGYIYLHQGDYGMAIMRQKAAIAILDDMGSTMKYDLMSCLALTYATMNALEQTKLLVQQVLDDVEKMTPWSSLHVWGMLIQALALTGDVVKADTLLNQRHLKYSFDTGLPNIVIGVRTEATIRLLQGRIDEAITLLDEYLPHLDQPIDRLWGLPELYFLKGKAHLEQDKSDLAITALMRAKELSLEIGEHRFRWQILGLLAKIETARGNQGIVDAYLEEARATLDYIIERIPEGELRTSFLAMSEVDALLTH